jgi:tripartite-type tricarboxylate transporter receptor subunit TctC
MTHSPASLSRRAMAAFLVCAPLVAGAQGAYPTHEIRLVVPWGAGGSVDIIGRRIAKIAEQDGLRLVVDNLPGATGAIGLAKVAGSAPDGYTLGLATSSQQALVAQGMTKTRNDQFTYLNQVAVEQFVLLVQSKGAVQTLPAYFKSLKDRPGKVSVAIAGSNNVPQIFAATMAKAQGAEVIPVAYNGGAKAVQDLAGGQVDSSILKPSEVKGQLDAGLVKAIATFADKRLPTMPSVPTFAELGLNMYPDGPLPQTTYLVGPAGMPPEIVARLTRVFSKVIASEEYRKFADDYEFSATDSVGPALKKQIDELQGTLDKVAPKMFKKE